jgi:hypothetical protein
VPAYWILPNREQRDELFASDGTTTAPLKQVLPPLRRPAGFSHGVPTEILERQASKNRSQILFAQRFPNWDTDRQLIAIATPAGVDRSGRIVHLTLLFILGANEQPRFDVPLNDLSEADRTHAAALLRRLSAGDKHDKWARSVSELLQVAPELGPVTNVELERSPTPFAALYRLGARGLTRNEKLLKTGLITFNVLTILAIVVALFYLRVHSCGAMTLHSIEQRRAAHAHVTASTVGLRIHVRRVVDYAPRPEVQNDEDAGGSISRGGAARADGRPRTTGVRR